MQSVWFSVEAADVRAIVCTGFTVKLADAVAIVQVFPVVLIEMVKGDPTSVVGDPEIVKVVPETAAVIPVGKPVTVALVAPPPMVYVIGVMAVLIQSTWFSVPAADVKVIV